jgi:hypothetical protein
MLDRFRKHPSEDALLLWMSDELSAPKKQNCEQHMAVCAKCRTRLDRLQRAFSQAVDYRDHCIPMNRPRQDERRHRLVAELEKLALLEPIQDETLPRSFHPRPRLKMNPILATAMVCALVSVACVFVWLQQARPGITSNALLVRAESWDLAADGKSASGVIEQTVKITTRKRTLKRTILRDAQGKRQLKVQQLANDEAQLKEKLADAGVVWDAPLSATAYQDWHDRQRVRQDRIRRSSGNLLVLTTTVPSGDVAEQSLTVRDTDFHPVVRTVEFRNRETVEIAELDYHVLPWTAAEANLFLPEGVSGSDYASRQLSFVVLPPMPLTEGQLDEAELGVRLVLNKLHADTGEQIQIERRTSGVEVKGLVETDKRKRELMDQLQIVPRLKISILSMEELRRRPDDGEETTSLTAASVTAQSSPLETYFVSHGKDAQSLRSLSQRLLENALTVSQESRALSGLNLRFTPNEEMSPLAQGTLSMLLFSHREKRDRALDEEQRLFDQLSGMIGEAQLEPGHGTDGTRSSTTAASVAERNLTLCEELTLGSSTQPRRAEDILPDLATTLMQLHRSVQQQRIQSQNAGVSGEKR